MIDITKSLKLFVLLKIQWVFYKKIKLFVKEREFCANYYIYMYVSLNIYKYIYIFRELCANYYLYIYTYM